MEEHVENLRRQLRFRSWHRGTREMDLIMGSFADAHLPNFTPNQLKAYEAFLVENDPDIYDWYCGRGDLPEHVDTEILTLLRAHRVVG